MENGEWGMGVLSFLQYLCFRLFGERLETGRREISAITARGILSFCYLGLDPGSLGVLGNGKWVCSAWCNIFAVAMRCAPCGMRLKGALRAHLF